MKKVEIAGCCVSRDLFNYDRLKNYEVLKFIQLNPISLQDIVEGGIEFLPDFRNIVWQSAFIKRCAECALGNHLASGLLESGGGKS